MSLVGGGSRLSYYFKKKGSAVLSTSIDKYVYITLNKKFDSNISLSYLITENVHNERDLISTEEWLKLNKIPDPYI